MTTTTTDCRARIPAACRYHGSLTSLEEEMTQAAYLEDFTRYAQLREATEKRIQEVMNTSDEDDLVALAGDPETASLLLDRLSEHDNPAVRVNVAGNPLASPDTLLRLALTDDDPMVFVALAGNPASTPEVLRVVIQEQPLYVVKQLVARHPNVPVDVSEMLADDRSWMVREAVASSDYAPEHVLSFLKDDDVTEVRAAVGENPRSPRPVLTYLYEDEDPLVRLAVKENPAFRDVERERFAAESGVDRAEFPDDLIDAFLDIGW